MEVKIKTRDPYFDNFKGLLIISVIVIHLIHDLADEYEICDYIYMYLMMYAMPGFIFMSGYFSRNIEKCRRTAVQNFLIPYFLFDIIESVMQYMDVQPDMPFYEFMRLTVPKWGLWYLFAMFVFRMFAADIKKMRGAVLIAFLFGLAAGFFPDLGAKFALGRIGSMLFFFTMGLCFEDDAMDKVRHINKFLAVVVIIGMAFLIPYLMHYRYHGVHILTRGALLARGPYPVEHTKIAMGRRAIFYVLGSIMTFMLMAVTPKTKTFLTKIGKNSISVYVFHLFIVYILRTKDFFLQPVLIGKRGALIVVCMAFVIAFLLSREPVRKFYDFLVNGVNKIIFREKAV